MDEETIDTIYQVVAIVFAGAALARLIVNLTPTKEDDVIMAKIEAVLNLFLGGFRQRSK
jgi:hypothetical protein